jgi:signal transduction histidine kinase
MPVLHATARRLRETPISLVWPLLLIVPPVIVLSIVSLYSLREDRAAIDREARRTVSLLVADLARRWSTQVQARLAARLLSACASPAPGLAPATPTTGDAVEPVCGLIVEGRIRVPIDYAPLPSLPAWLRDLPAAYAHPWRLLADAASDAELATLRRAAAALADAPDDIRLNAEWQVARAEANRTPSPGTTARLADLARRSAGVVTDSGAPLSDLALLLALRHAPAGEVPEELLRDVRRHILESPSFLTHALVEEATRIAPASQGVADLGVAWTTYERTLALLRRLPPDVERPMAVWLQGEPLDWVAFVHPLVSRDAPNSSTRSAVHVALVPATIVETLFETVSSSQNDIPPYARVALRLGGRTWRPHGRTATPTGSSAATLNASSAPPVELAAADGQIDVPMVLPSSSVSMFAGELLRVAPQAVDVRQQGLGMFVRLSGPPGTHPFTVALELLDADLLYARYRTRLWMAIGLILGTTLVALAGVAVSWRAMARQRRLAEMRSNFVASASHELRAPIAAVRLMAESLERGTIEPGNRQREYLRLIVQECRRLSSLIANVLDFARIDREGRAYRFELTDLHALLVQTVEIMGPYAAERDVRLRCAPDVSDADVGSQPVDQQALQQALVNLLDNAIKHSPAGAEVVAGIEVVRAASGSRATPAQLVRLYVEDRGPGIPPDEHGRIFEPFYRRGSELRRETRGIGIGLSIVKHVAEAHRGRVVLTSSPGAGSRFAIELPGREENGA